MESKVTTDYNKAKIVVDFYKANVIGMYVCSCYTPNADVKEEPEYLVRNVSYDQLKEHFADSKGMIDIEFSPDDQKLITFNKFLNNCHKDEIEKMCAEVINKREGRTGYYSPTKRTA
jgi:hypothetical protein